MNLIYTRKPYTIIMIFLLGFFSATASATTMIAPSETFPGESFTIIDTIEGRLQDGSVAIFSSASVSLEVPLRTQEPFKTAHGIVPITIPPDIYSVSLRQPDDTVIFIGTLTVVYDAEENPIPSLLVDIFSSATTVYAGDNVTLTVTETNDGNVNLESAYVEVNNGVGSLVAPPTSGDDGDGVLEPGETWVWTGIDVTINTDTTFSAIGHGIDPLGNDIIYPGVFVKAIPFPTTMVTISASAATVSAGDNVTLTVTETNDGNVSLYDAYVEVNNGVGSLVAPPTSGDDGNNVLDPGETWVWTGMVVTINTDTTFSAIGHGIDPLGNDITFPSDLDEKDEIPIQVID